MQEGRESERVRERRRKEEKRGGFTFDNTSIDYHQPVSCSTSRTFNGAALGEGGEEVEGS